MLMRFEVEGRRPNPIQNDSRPGAFTCWKFAVILLVGIIGLFVGEIGSTSWAVRRCRLPVQETPDTPLFVAVSDVHILGQRKTWLDIQWTTWQLKKGLWIIQKVLRPTALFILGDHLDQGGRADEEEWALYVSRYKWATDFLKQETPVIESVIGNHDAQFAHLGLTSSMMERFDQAFGNSNGNMKFGNVDVYWINSLALYDDSASAAHQQTMSFLEEVSKKEKEEQDFRILLSHVPSFRENDLDCGKSRLREGTHVTYVGPEVYLKPNEDVLNLQVSRFLLGAIKPDVMLSGHLHSHCYRQNYYEVMTPQLVNVTFLDLSVPTLSYRMRPDPGLTIVAFANGRAYGKTCKLPSERTIMAFDVISIALIVIGVFGSLVEIRKLTSRHPLKVE